jgi:hypothetical protein
MKLQLFRNQCGRCGTTYTTYSLPADSYGPILFATPAGEVTLVSPDEDPVWDEVSRLVDEAVSHSGLNTSEKADVFDRALSRTLDRGQDGECFSAWGNTPCPRCLSKKLSYFAPMEPPQFKEVELKTPGHEAWMALEPEAKKAAIASAIRGWLKPSP